LAASGMLHSSAAIGETLYHCGMPGFTADGEGRYIVDSVCWLGQHSLAASGLWFDADDSSEGVDAYNLGITWDSWAGTEGATPQGLQVKHTGFIPLPVSKSHTSSQTCQEASAHRQAVAVL